MRQFWWTRVLSYEKRPKALMLSLEAIAPKWDVV